MIQSIHVTNSAGETLDLDLWNVAQGESLGADRLRIFNIEGLGSPKATVTGLSGPLYDGVTGHFVKTDARHLLITLVIPRRGDYEELARREIYQYFPGKGEIKFRVVTDRKDVYAMATVESVEMNHFSKSVNAVISLYCPYPYWLDQSGIGQYGEFNGTSQAIINDGAYAIGALFTLYFGQDNQNNLILENSNGSQTFTLNYTEVPGGIVQAGDKIYIDTRGGQQQVMYEPLTGPKKDITLGVTATSDWIQLLPGTNWISLTLDTLEGKPANAPNDLYLSFYLPLNEVVEQDPYELADNTDMDVLGGDVAVGQNEGVMYLHARLFNEAEEAYVQANAHGKWCPAGDFSVVFWARIPVTTADPSTQKHYIISVDDDIDDGWRVWYWRTPSAGLFRFEIGSDGIWKTASSPSYTKNDEWHCFILTYDVSAEEMSLRWMPYTGSTITSVPAPLAYLSEIKIGGGVSGELYWPGYLQGLALYNGLVLNSDNMDWVYNSGNGRTFAELTGTVELFVDYSQGYQGV